MIKAILIGFIPVLCAVIVIALDLWIHPIKTMSRFEQEAMKDCRTCKQFASCPCGKQGHENGTSIGYSIGKCQDYEPII